MDSTLQFKDGKELEVWLQDKPVDWAQVIAARSALRVFPLVFSIARFPDSVISPDRKQRVILSAWRAIFISWAARKYATHDMTAAAAAAAGSDPGDYMVAFAAANAATAAGEAVLAVFGYNAAAVNAANVAAATDAAVADAAADSEQSWTAISADCRWLSNDGNGLIERPLWPSDVRENSRFKANFPPWARAVFDEFDGGELAKNTSWGLIVAWYRAVLPNSMSGKPQSLWGERIDVEIATQPDEFWKREPQVVMDAIAKIAGWKPVLAARVEGDLPSMTAEGVAKAGDPSVRKKNARSKSAKASQPAGKGTAQGGSSGPVSEEVSSEADAVEGTDHIELVETENHRDTESEFLSDHPDAMVDYLERSAIAFQLAGRINQIWDTQNPVKKQNHGPAGYLSALWTGRWKKRWDNTLDTGFVVHLDAPWGGGKTNFASYVTRILNPWRDAEMPKWLTDLDLPGDADWMERYRRPWLVVNFNAWNHQHVDPPWWVFAETIRQQCMTALRSEANQREAGSFPDPLPAYDYLDGPTRFLGNATLWIRERVWRMQLGAASVPLVVASLTFAAIYVMYRIGWVSTSEGKLVFFGEFSALALAALASLFGGVATIRGAVDYVAKNLFSGTPAAAQRFELGSADPLERFRHHFARTIEDFGRPIVVVVDDLDRCSPKYVVDLVRGMQTVMVSPRIVYLLLGDRDWIEKAFAETHKAMAAIDVGPEHSFGGRFVEKAIQMSFVLPDMDPERREKFTESILKKHSEEVGRPKEGVAEAVLSNLMARQALEIGTQDIGQVLGTGNFRVREQAADTLIKQVRSSDIAAEAKTAFEVDFSARLARKAATDQSVVKETGHMLVGLAPMLPGNPRQIKRIVNTITVMQQVARLRVEDFRPLADDVKWQKLARWVVVMTEWPQTWFTLTRHPGIMDWVLPHSGRSPKSEEDMKLAA